MVAGSPRKDVVDLDGRDALGHLQQRQCQGAESRPHLHDDVLGTDVGGAHDAPHRVGVDDEVLTALFGGAHTEGGREFADVGGAQEGVGVELLTEQGYGRCDGAAHARRRAAPASPGAL